MSEAVKRAQPAFALTSARRRAFFPGIGCLLVCILPAIFVRILLRVLLALVWDDDAYSHIPFVLAVSAFFLVADRKRIFAAPAGPRGMPAAIAIAGAAGVALAGVNPWHWSESDQISLLVLGFVLLWSGAFGIFFGAMLIGRYGWRPFFVALGLFSLLWLPPWKKWMPTGPGLLVSPAAQMPSILEILKQRSAWGTFLGLFAFNYLSYFLLTWLPSFLVSERHFSMQKMGGVGGAAYLILALSAVACGWISDLWILRGGTPTRVRKTFTSLGLGFASIFCLAVVVFAFDEKLAILFLFLTCASAGLCTSNLWSITQTIAGPLAAGKWSGLQNCVGNFAGIIAPALTGFVVQRTGHFFWAFAVTAGVLLMGALSWGFVVGRVEPLRWQGKDFVAVSEVSAG